MADDNAARPTPGADDATLESYRVRVERVMAHIERALAGGEGPLDLDSLAAVGCFSRFHFHRIYRVVTGETPAQTVRRLRLHRAAVALLEDGRPVAEIAKEAGYGSVEAFTRAFTAAYQSAPAAYRESRRAWEDAPLGPVRVAGGAGLSPGRHRASRILPAYRRDV